MKNNLTVKEHKRLCRKPDFLYRWKGRSNARKGGEQLVQITIERMINVQNVLEYKMVQATEEALSEVRSNAAKALALRNRSGADGAAAPFPTADAGAAAEVRIQRRSRGNHNASTDQIVAANETITKAHALLEDEIEHTRARLSDKVYAYVIGVRKVLPDYEYGPLFTGNTALDTYLRQHETLDSEIRTVAETAWKMTDNTNS